MAKRPSSGVQTPPAVPHIAGFEILGKLGEGGMGAVYRARDSELDRIVAIKLLRQGFQASDLRERFRQEARSAARLTNPNIVTIHSFGEHDGVPYIVMEYLRGATLDRLIQLNKPIALVQKLDMIETLCTALGYAHSRGVIHRDIKPSNLMITPTGVLKILDFGLARALEGSGVTRTHAVLGTPNYMSPEHFRDFKTVDKRSDIFALGAVSYELLTSRQAFPGDVMQAIYAITYLAPKPFDYTVPDQDARLERVVLKALQKDPQLRYPDLAELRDDLRELRRVLDLHSPGAMTLTEILDSVGDPLRETSPVSLDSSRWKETTPLEGDAAGPRQPDALDLTQSTPHLDQRIERHDVSRWRRPIKWASGALVLVVLAVAARWIWPLATPAVNTGTVNQRSSGPPVASGGGSPAVGGAPASTGGESPDGRATPSTNGLMQSVQRSLGAGLHADALDAIVRADRDNPADPEVARSLDTFIQVMRRDYDQRRQAFGDAPNDPKAGVQYRLATSARARAEKLFTSGNRLQSGRTFLSAYRSLQRAAVLNAKSAASATTTASAGNNALTPSPHLETNPTGSSSTAHRQPTPDAPAVKEPDPELPNEEVGKKAETHPAESAAPNRVDPPKADTPARPTPAESVAAPTEQIQDALRRYREGYERLDFSALRNVWPGAPNALADEFAKARSYRLELAETRIEVQGDSARVSCVRHITVQPVVGRQQSVRRKTVFTLRRSAQYWVITDVQ